MQPYNANAAINDRLDGLDGLSGSRRIRLPISFTDVAFWFLALMNKRSHHSFLFFENISK